MARPEHWTDAQVRQASARAWARRMNRLDRQSEEDRLEAIDGLIRYQRHQLVGWIKDGKEVYADVVRAEILKLQDNKFETQQRIREFDLAQAYEKAQRQAKKRKG